MAVGQLHKATGVPSLAESILSGRVEKDKALEIVLSDEAAALRAWLKDNLDSGVDIRDSFIGKSRRLPSKKQWASWLRFGTTTTLSTALSFALTSNPALATILGIVIGAVDTARGEAVSKRLLDPYHPDEWISYLDRKLASTNA